MIPIRPAAHTIARTSSVRAFCFVRPAWRTDLGVQVPYRPLQGELLAGRQGRRREAWSEGSRRQSAGPTNRNRIRGVRAG